MSSDSRTFTVFHNQTGERQAVKGVNDLAKLLNVPVSEIPLVYIHKVTFTHHTVYEDTRQSR